MNENEHYLDMLAEECCEVGQRASKALRFGLTEVQPGQTLTNAERIVEEAKDLISILRILHSRGLIPDFEPSRTEYVTKLEKIARGFQVSRREGTLTE